MPELRYRDIGQPPEGYYAAEPGSFVRDRSTFLYWTKIAGYGVNGWAQVGGNQFERRAMVEPGVDFGADMTGATNANAEVLEAIDYLNDLGGGTLLLAGTYLVYGLDGDASSFHVENCPNLTIVGIGGGGFKREAGIASPDATRIAKFDNCDNLRIYDVAWDANGIERFGGINIDNSDGVRLRGNDLTDSNLQATWADYDHFGFIVQHCTDVWAVENRAVDVELIELDNIDGFHVLHNKLTRPRGSAGIAAAAVGDGYYFLNGEIAFNTFIDPGKSSMYLQNESGGTDDTIWRGIRIHHNRTERRTAGINVGGAHLVVGNGTGVAATGNIYEDWEIYKESVYVAPGVTRNAAEIAIRHNQAGEPFDGMIVEDIDIDHQGVDTGDYLVQIQRITNGRVKRIRTRGNDYGLSVSRVANSEVDLTGAEGTTISAIFATSSGSNIVQSEKLSSPSITLGTGDRFVQQPRWVDKTTDTARTSDTTLTDDPHLSLTGEKNAVYEFEFLGIYDGDAAGDIKFALGGAGLSGGAVVATNLGPQSGSAAGSATSMNVLGTTGASGTIGAVGAGTKVAYLMRGRLTTGATSGAITVQWAQGTSSATATTLFAGSYFKLRRVR